MAGQGSDRRQVQPLEASSRAVRHSLFTPVPRTSTKSAQTGSFASNQSELVPDNGHQVEDEPPNHDLTINIISFRTPARKLGQDYQGPAEIEAANNPISTFLGTRRYSVPDGTATPPGGDESRFYPSNLDAKSPDPLKMLWVHVPTNNTRWVSPVLKKIIHPLKLNLSITEDKFFLHNQSKSYENKPHFQSLLPSSFFSILGSNELYRCKQFAFYMPYLHWDTVNCFRSRTKFMQEISGGKNPPVPRGLEDQRSALYQMAKRFNEDSSFHPRRSLYQFAFSRDFITTVQDWDQVLSRYTNSSGNDAKMLMVDQLWLWVIDPNVGSSEKKLEEICSQSGTPEPKSEFEGEAGYTSLLTFFPQKEDEGESNTMVADLKSLISDEIMPMDSGNCKSAWYIAAVTIKKAVEAMFQVRHESLDFLEVFREAITVAGGKQTKFFHKFHLAIDQKSVLANIKKQKQGELHLVFEISDIQDELSAISQLLRVQGDTISQAVKIYDKQVMPNSLLTDEMKSATAILREALENVRFYDRQIEWIKYDADRTYNSMLVLLDLEQKEANYENAQSSSLQTELALLAGRQAEIAQEQADAASAQSQILILFTVVTIIFLPLSFFTSYFAMEAVILAGSEGSQQLSHAWKIMGPASGGIISFCLGTSLAVYFITRRQLTQKRKRASSAASIQSH